MKGINRCTSEVPCALKLKDKDETTSTVNASTGLISSHGNSAAAMLLSLDETGVFMLQLEERNCLWTHFKAILKKYSLEDHDTDDFCFIKKCPFSIYSDNLQKYFSKVSKFVAPSSKIGTSESVVTSAPARLVFFVVRKAYLGNVIIMFTLQQQNFLEVLKTMIGFNSRKDSRDPLSTLCH